MAIVLDGTTGITTPDLTDTSLTSGRVVYAGTSGNLTGSTALTFDGAILGVNGISVGRGAGAVATNTAVGASALAVTTGSSSGNTGVGAAALAALTSGTLNTALGWNAMALATTATNNVALGENTLFYNNGSANTAVGFQALQGTGGNTYSNNTAVGYQAGYSQTTAAGSVCIGYKAGYADATSGYSVYVGENCGLAATGVANTFIGESSGSAVTSGYRNTILGRYNGNQGGLDIRTASNKVVASDGDGNLAFHNDASQWTTNPFANIDITQGTAGSSTTNTIGITQNTATGIFSGNNAFSGMFIINDMNNTGSAALILTSGNTLTIVSQSGGTTFVNSSSPSAAQIGVYVSASVVIVKPGLAGTTNFRIIALRTRATQ